MRKIIVPLALFLATGNGTLTGASDPASALSGFVESLEKQRAKIVEIRRDIHRHPEPSGMEERTARVVAEYLKSMGFQVRTGIGGHGVVGILPGDASGPTVAFRADMDAVQSGAEDPMEFRSVVEGVNHICGHDIHTAVGLALAAGFSAIRDRLTGSVMLVFQPSEEMEPSGARAMLNDGVFSERKPDAILAYHTWFREVGQVMGVPGKMIMGRDDVRVSIHGEGNLQETASKVSELLQEIATECANQNSIRRHSLGNAFVVCMNEVQSSREGDAWVVRATLTTSSREASASARQRIEAALMEFEENGQELSMDYQKQVPGADNDPELVERADAVMKTVLGDDGVRRWRNISAQFSEDFGFFQEQVPGAIYFLGVSNSAKGWDGRPHSPTYVADEEAIFIGAKAMAAVFLDLFEHPLKGTR